MLILLRLRWIIRHFIVGEFHEGWMVESKSEQRKRGVKGGSEERSDDCQPRRFAPYVLLVSCCASSLSDPREAKRRAILRNQTRSDDNIARRFAPRVLLVICYASSRSLLVCSFVGSLTIFFISLRLRSPRHFHGFITEISSLNKIDEPDFNERYDRPSEAVRIPRRGHHMV